MLKSQLYGHSDTAKQASESESYSCHRFCGLAQANHRMTQNMETVVQQAYAHLGLVKEHEEPEFVKNIIRSP